MTDNTPLWIYGVLAVILGVFLATAVLVNDIRNELEVQTCIAAQGKYLDDTDFEGCGYDR